MKCNIGKTDKIIRLIVGVVIIAVGIFYKSWWGAVGLIPLLTALSGFCLLYVPFKISTVKEKKE
jgi:hypothetical protein